MDNDKYELVLDIIEHPDKYTSERLNEIMSDQDTREIYNLLCKADSAVEANKAVNVDSEWEKFNTAHLMPKHRPFRCFGSRAASIALLVSSSIVAVATGIVVTVAVIDSKPETVSVTEPSGRQTAVRETADSASTKTEETMTDLTPIVFENEPLDTIMEAVSKAYGVEIKFNDDEAASLHLYYKFDPSLPLDDIVSQLNTFEQINIVLNGNIICVHS